MKQDAEDVFMREWRKSKLGIYFVVALYALTIKLNAQNIPMGSWRTHFSYEHASLVETTTNNIFCAVENGLFFVDTEDFSVNKFSKIDGLSDATISAMAFNSDQSVLTIGYENGNIDLILNDRVANIDLIKNENISSPKTIRHISFHEEKAFLSTSFGIVVIDLNQRTIKEVYREIGQNGTTPSVYQTLTINDSLFAVTDEGILKASLTQDLNLLDFSNWETIANSISIQPNSIAALGNSIYASNDTTVFHMDGETLNPIYSDISGINSIKSYDQTLYILGNSSLLKYQDEQIEQIEYIETRSPRDVVEVNGDLWIADQNQSLVQFDGTNSQSIKPNGPVTDHFEKIKYFNDTIFGFGPYRSGGNQSNQNEFYSTFSGAQWLTISDTEFRDVSDISNQYLASYGDGLKNRITGEIIDASTAGSLFEESNDETTIAAIHENDFGFWILNANSDSNNLHLVTNVDWQTFDLSLNNPEKIQHSANQRLIISSASTNPSGIVIFDPIDKSTQRLTTSNSDLPSNIINDFEIDQDDELWIATTLGIAYLPSASTDIFSGFNGVIIPVFENSLLFNDENINCIEVDPGNRKWVGTSSGAYLFEEAAQSLVYHFTTQNSPLPSNNVLDIAIHPVSGEVFILTSKGMVSYRSDASRSVHIHQDVQIFPNPVRPGYNGVVGVTGLATDNNVKITDISGKLIREINANGGSLQWDLKDYNGSGAQSGVYLFFSSNSDGSETYVGKLLIIR